MGKHWEMLGKPDTLEASYPDGGTNTLDMWTYWRLLAGEVYVDQPYRDASDLDPPVLNVEMMKTPVVNEERSAARREWKECVGPGRARGSPYLSKSNSSYNKSK